MKRIFVITLCSVLVVIFIIGFIFLVPSKNKSTDLDSSSQTSKCEISVPSAIYIEQGTNQEMFNPSIICSSAYTVSFSISNTNIASIENNTIKGLQIGDTLIKTTVSYLGGSVAKYTNVTVYERTQNLKIFVSDEYGEVDSIYFSTSNPITYYLTILDENVANSKIEHSINIHNLTLELQEPKKLVYSFIALDGEKVEFKVTNNNQSKIINLDCNKIADGQTTKYYFELAVPSTFENEHSISGNTLTFINTQFVPLTFKLVNDQQLTYPLTYTCSLSYKTELDCSIEKENNSIFISSSQTGIIYLTLTNLQNPSISTTFTIVLM